MLVLIGIMLVVSVCALAEVHRLNKESAMILRQYKDYYDEGKEAIGELLNEVMRLERKLAVVKSALSMVIKERDIAQSQVKNIIGLDD